jgi:hypothetical protein
MVDGVAPAQVFIRIMWFFLLSILPPPSLEVCICPEQAPCLFFDHTSRVSVTFGIGDVQYIKLTNGRISPII